MGYETKYSLIVQTDNCEIEDLIIETLSNISGYHMSDITAYGIEGKWYSHEADMKEISKLNPRVLFELSGEGEESDDMWKKYFKNGKMQTVRARITYEDFDEGKLK